MFFSIYIIYTHGRAFCNRKTEHMEIYTDGLLYSSSSTAGRTVPEVMSNMPEMYPAAQSALVTTRKVTSAP